MARKSILSGFNLFTENWKKMLIKWHFLLKYANNIRLFSYLYLDTELEKVPSSASVLVRKDFGIREKLRKAQGGKKIESPTILGKEEHKEKNNLKIFSWRVVVL